MELLFTTFPCPETLPRFGLGSPSTFDVDEVIGTVGPQVPSHSDETKT